MNRKTTGIAGYENGKTRWRENWGSDRNAMDQQRLERTSGLEKIVISNR